MIIPGISKDTSRILPLFNNFLCGNYLDRRLVMSTYLQGHCPPLFIKKKLTES
jgi:hypothetical protein